MVLLYMVLHGSHILPSRLTPVMLALIYQHHGSYGPWKIGEWENLKGQSSISGNKPSFNPRPARENFPRLLDVQICEVRCSIHPELNGLQWLMDTMPWWFIPPILGDIPGYFRRSRVNQSMLIHLLETKLLKWDEPPSIGKHAIHYVQFLRAWFLSSEKRNATTQEIQLLWRFRQLKYWDNQR